MPRGNDNETPEQKAATLHQLADQFGEGVGDAEALINANAAHRTTELAAISTLPVIQDETNELDLDKLKGPNGEYVVDAVVRGAGRTKGTIVVYETEDGRTLKYLESSNYDERPSSGPRRPSQAQPDDDEAGGGKADTQASRKAS